MADGKQSEFERIKAIPILEFWQIFDLWKDKTEREIEIAKKKAEAGIR